MSSDSEDELFKAMETSSPLRPALKRPRTGSQSSWDENGEPENEGDQNEGLAPPSSSDGPLDEVHLGTNALQVLRRYAKKKCLRADQNADLEVLIKVSFRFSASFLYLYLPLQEPPVQRCARLLAHQFVLQNLLERIVTTAAPYEPSEDLKVGLLMYVYSTN